MPYGDRMPYYKICPICNKKHKVAFWELKSKKTCSFECSKEYKRKLPISKETRKKISLKLKGIYVKEKSSQWKGDQASYTSKHEWIRKNSIIPKTCEKCKKIRKVDASNISGKHLRDIKDYEWLCRRCHLEKDGILDKKHLRKIGKIGRDAQKIKKRII